MKIIRRMPDTNEPRAIRQDGYLHTILMGFRNAIEKHNTSVVIVIDGKSGMGKTTLGNQIGITLDKNFNLDSLYYTPEEFLKGLSTAKQGDCLMFDEAMLISSRSALSSINRMIIQGMSMIRSKKIYVIFCVNSIFDLDRNLAISRADLLLHVYGESLIKRGSFCAFFKSVEGIDRIKLLYLYGKKFYDYTKPDANFVGNFPPDFIVDEKEYEIRKQKGVNAFLTGTIGSKTQKAITTRNRLIVDLKNKGWEAKEIAKVSGLDENSVWDICAGRQKTGNVSQKTQDLDI